MLKTYYMYQIKMLVGETYKQEIRYYERKKELSEPDLCDVPNFHEGQKGMFLRKDCMFMGGIQIDFDKQETFYHKVPANTNIVNIPFDVNPVVIKLPIPSIKQKKPVQPQHVPLRANIIAKDRCTYCGEVLTSDQRKPSFKTIDHVYPTSRFGINLQANKVPCCAFCNSFKSDYLMDEFLNRIIHLLKNYPTKSKIKMPAKTTLNIMLCNVRDFINNHALKQTKDGKFFYKEIEVPELV